MKKAGVLFVIMAMALSAMAQEDAISRFYKKYENNSDFTRINISPKMFSMFADLELNGDKEDQEVMNMIKDLKGLKILSHDNTKNGMALYEEAFKLLPKNEFEELMSIQEKDNQMKFMIREKNGTINELVMLIGGEKEFFLMSIMGNLDLKQLSKLSGKMNIKGLEELEKLDDKKKRN